MVTSNGFPHLSASHHGLTVSLLLLIVSEAYSFFPSLRFSTSVAFSHHYADASFASASSSIISFSTFGQKGSTPPPRDKRCLVPIRSSELLMAVRRNYGCEETVPYCYNPASKAVLLRVHASSSPLLGGIRRKNKSSLSGLSSLVRPLFSSNSDAESHSPSSKDDDHVVSRPPSTSTFTEDLQNVFILVGVQCLLIPVSIALANVLHIPNQGLGSGFVCDASAIMQGIMWAFPLFIIAGIMRLLEPYSQALRNVSKATQRSVLSVMGPMRRPLFAILVSALLGLVAGWGEEWLFRGVIQTLLSQKWGDSIALGVSGLVFGLLHAVTPVYAFLAAAASIFFGYLYNTSHNLAVPMVCHAIYDVGALLWAHWSVTALSSDEQEEIMNP